MTKAVVLAGSLNEGQLKACSSAYSEALIKIGNRYMVEYVVDALMNASKIKEIIIAGPKEQLQDVFHNSDKIKLVAAGSTIIDSFLNATTLLEEYTSERLLILTSDIPLITVEIIDSFLELAEGIKADVVYPIVAKDLNDITFPGVKRTYVKLKEGTYTGGNVFFINPLIVNSCVTQAKELVSLRKSPLRLAKYIGIVYIIKYLLNNLSIIEAEKKISQLLNIRAKAICVPYPEIGVDVDKPSDLDLVRKILVN